MSDWKGTEVIVSIYLKKGVNIPSEWIKSIVVMLDTDTINNLFDEYRPNRYEFILLPT